MTDIVINSCFGEFGLTEAAVRWMRERGSDRAKYAVLLDEPYHDGSGICGQGEHGEFIRRFFSVNNLRLANEKYDDYSWRADPLLVECVKELGEAAASDYAKLKVVTVPDDVDWTIDEYDGLESVEEQHRSWS